MVKTAVPKYLIVLKTVPLLAPENGEAAMKLDEFLGSVSMGLKAFPYAANTVSSIVKNQMMFYNWKVR